MEAPQWLLDALDGKPGLTTVPEYIVDGRTCEDCDDRQAKAFLNTTHFDGTVTDVVALCSGCLEGQVRSVLASMDRTTGHGRPQLRRTVRFQVFLGML